MTVNRMVRLALAAAIGAAGTRALHAAEAVPVAPPAVSPPRAAGLSDEALSGESLARFEKGSGLLRRLERERDALAKNLELLAALRGRREALDAFPAPAPAEGGSPAEAASAALEAAGAAQERDRERVRLLQEEQGLLRERAQRLAAAVSASMTLDSALAEWRPFAVENERRGKPLSPPEAELFALGAAEEAARRARERAPWWAQARRMPEESRDLLALIEEAGRTAEASEAAHWRAERGRRLAALREAVSEEIEARDPASLPALLAGLEGDRERLAAAESRARAEAEAARSGAAEKEREIGRPAAPDAETPPLESDPALARVREAEKVWRRAEAAAAGHARRADLLEGLAASLRELQEKEDRHARAAAALEERLLRMEACARALARGREEGPPLPSGAAPAALAAARAALEPPLPSPGRLAARLSAAQAQAAQARTAERSAREPLPALRAAFEAAKEAAQWTREVERLPSAEVVRRFEEARGQAGREREAAARSRAAWTQAREAVDEQERQLAAVEDPVVRRSRSAGLLRAIRAEVHRAAGREPPSSERPAAEPPPAPGLPAAEAAARNAFFAGRGRYFEELARARGRLLSALERSEALGQELLKALGQEEEALRKAHGAALELKIRIGGGTLSEKELPEGAALAIERGPITAVEGERGETQALLSKISARRAEASRAAAAAERRRALNQEALSIAGRERAALVERAAAAAPEGVPPAGESETQRKRRRQEVERRLEAEDSAVEAFLGLFSSERARDLRELLLSLYEELADLEREGPALGARRSVSERLIALAGEERKVVESLLPLVREDLAEARADWAAARISAGLVLPTEPAWQDLLQDLRAAGRAETPGRRELPRDPVEIERLADGLFDLASRRQGIEAWAAELERRLSRLGIDAEVGREKDEIGAVEARLEEVRGRIARLRGRPDAEIDRRPAGERPAAEGERERLRLGEIAWTRAAARAALWRSMASSAVRILAIPLCALLLVRLAGRLGGRIVRRVEREGEGDSEGGLRARTLVQVFKTAWTAAVWVVAAIYLLGELRVDVTPLLASAGIAGIALAFGVQSLIRDVFTGFFLLLENQYRIGDIIKIGDVGGVVEKITLRVTVLRDLHGVVHFFPNGTINRVSNMTKGWSRAVVEIGVGYQEDVDQVTACLGEIGEAMRQDARFGPLLLDTPDIPGVESLGEGRVTIRLLLKTLPGKQWDVAREARRRIKKAFEERGIHLPFFQRVVYPMAPPEPK